MRNIRPGSHGPEVSDVQQRLVALGELIDAAELDGTYGDTTEAAVRRFQSTRMLRVDGIVGSETWGHLVEAGYLLGDRTLYLRFPYFRGDDVRELQRKLNALGFDAWREDGIFGEAVDRAVREFQHNIGAEADGIVGPETCQTLQRLRPDMSGPGRAVIREAESLRHSIGMDGAVIAVDVSPADDDLGSLPDPAAIQLGRILVEELRHRGADARLLAEPGDAASPSERARAANALGAAVCVSLQTRDRSAPEQRPGVACSFFGTELTHSPAGQRLAAMIQQELITRLHMDDHGAGPLAVSILRETRMTAVSIETSFADHAPSIARDIASAIATGVEAFLETPAEA